MVVKKSGGKAYGVTLTAAEQRALDAEINRRLAERTKRHTLEIEARVIRQVKRHTDWDEGRLKRFYDDFDDDINDLVKHYELSDDDASWLCTRELKLEGIDIEKWSEEKYPNTKWDVECK